MTPRRYALIVAGGSGTRMGSDTPKQFIPLLGIPMLMYTLRAFNTLKVPPQIQVVLPATRIEQWKGLCHEFSFLVPHAVVAGGDTRFDSVRNGLNSIPREAEGWVAIHDGVRPLIKPSLIESCFAKAEINGNAVPAIKPSESIRTGTSGSNQSMDRNSVWLIQTPQVFRLDALRKCYQVAWNSQFTDDASVAEAFGETIFLAEGDSENIKITSPVDLIYAEAILKSRG